MKKGIFALIAVCFVACDEFNVRRVTSDELYSEESRQINWREVDEYPTFEACKKYADKEASKCCFERKVAEYIYSRFGQNDIEVSESINDTLFLYLAISESGKPRIDSLRADSLVQQELPHLHEWLQQSVDSLPKIYPASKRGVPVSTVFKLPIVISSE